jgi:hypothetical protein
VLHRGLHAPLGLGLVLTFIGPFTITYLRAEEAPRRRVFPFGY